ncbi:trans-aconitate 2-methyltransferase [Ramlibacter sp. WS9]|uniref:class I SAM-dependent methyltransferase n=1 Tax=Ramlibacter sp. WS9 TaxID=1882741 RepID=UPI0011417374|nr:class I SAM-dependent methyltransferase [Ramlibacter sp. WS9]ROZ79125.1 class I SAM-dependent methyltransferase [Ramlibacter sp. WS9]
MKLCLRCHASFESSASRCPACGHAPSELDGFTAYSPEQAHHGGGFKAGYFSELAQLEDANFWFRGRNALIQWAIGKYCTDFRSLLEIGCGTAYVLSGVAKAFPQARLLGSEIFVAGLAFAATRLPSATFVQMDARDIPFVSEFDVIGAFDVIEHIEEDKRVLAAMHAALKPGGSILVTVPQHPWLWSAADEYACHVRRYRAAELHQKVRAAGFEIVRSTSFVSALLPAMMVSRLAHRQRAAGRYDPQAEFKIRPWLNTALESALACERGMIRAGIDLPVGGSRLLVARKPAHQPARVIDRT